MAKQRKLEDLSPGARAKRVAQLALKPGTRHAIPTKYLPAQYQQARVAAQRFAAPVTPGSSVTNLDAARQAKTATTVKYGQQDAQLAGLAKDTPGYYDRYIQDLQQGVTRQQQIGQDAASQLQSLQQGISGLSQASAGQMQQQANQDAATRGATAGDQTGLASNAAAIRQALVAALGAGEVGRSNANNTYVNERASVVGPGQKLQAVVGSQKNLANLRGEEGAYNQSIRDQIRGDESKNVLANQALGLNADKAKSDDSYKQAQLDLDRGVDPVTGKPLPKKAPTGYGPGAPGMNKFGYTYDEWTKLSPKDQAKARAGKGSKSGGAGGGPEWLTQQQMGAGLSQLTKLKAFAAKARGGEAFVPGHPTQKPLDRAAAAKKIFDNAPSLKDPVLLSAALDAIYNTPPHLSAETVRRLIAAGYKPSRVAQTLGVQTAQQYRKTPSAPRGPRPNPPADNGFPKPIFKAP